MPYHRRKRPDLRVRCPAPPAQVGRLEHGRGDFLADDVWNGIPIRVVYRWTVVSPTEARWEQAFSADGGGTWEVNWVMTFERVDAQPASKR